MEEASDESGVVNDDIFGYLGGYFFGNFRHKANINCNLQTKTNKKAVQAVAGKLHDDAVKFDTKQRSLQRHRAALFMTARLSCVCLFYSQLYSVAGPAKCRRIQLLQPFVGGV